MEFGALKPREQQLYNVVKRDMEAMGIEPFGRNEYHQKHFIPDDFQILKVDLKKMKTNENFHMKGMTKERHLENLEKLHIFRKGTAGRKNTDAMTLGDVMGVKDDGDTFDIVMYIMKQEIESQFPYPDKEVIKSSKSNVKDFLEMMIRMGYGGKIKEMRMKELFDARNISKTINDLVDEVFKEIEVIEGELVTNILWWMKETQSTKIVLDRLKLEEEK